MQHNEHRSVLCDLRGKPWIVPTCEGWRSKYSLLMSGGEFGPLFYFIYCVVFSLMHRAGRGGCKFGFGSFQMNAVGFVIVWRCILEHLWAGNYKLLFYSPPKNNRTRFKLIPKCSFYLHFRLSWFWIILGTQSSSAIILVLLLSALHVSSKYWIGWWFAI